MTSTLRNIDRTSTSIMSKMTVDLSIFFLKGAFKTWNFVLQSFKPLSFLSKFLLHLPARLFTKMEKTKIVIVGASFAGLEAAQHFAAHGGHLDVTLIDEKEYFEFTPGIFRCFTEPDHIADLTCTVDASLGRMVRGHVKSVQEGQVVVVQERDGERVQTVIPFDYCLLATGSTYPGVVRAGRWETAIESRKRTWEEQHAKLVASSSVIIVGGGMAGAELAAEIISAFPSKSVTLVHGEECMCKELPAAAKEYVEQWLTNRGVKLILNRLVTQCDDRRCVLEGGEVVQADCVYQCSGMLPRSETVANGAQPGSIDKKGFVRVNRKLQVYGRENVFAAGDVMMQDDFEDIKSGYLAERNAKVAACNILHHIHGESLLSYPEDVFGDVNMIPEVYCLSLSKYDGVMAFNNVVVTGTVPAVFKWLIEWSTVQAIRGMLACKAFLHINGVMSVFVSNHIMRPKEEAKLHNK